MLHWYCFSYIGKLLKDGSHCNACTYTGYEHKEVTLGMIKENKRNAGVADDAVLISVSYLGHMTREEFAE